MEKEFYVHGMHCPACEFLIEDKLSQVKGVKKVKANLSTCKVVVDADRNISTKELTSIVQEHGYTISTEKEHQKINYSDLGTGALLATAIFGAFMLLQKLGIVNLVNPTEMSLPFVFLIGVVASLSSCAAVVGGLVLSLSSNLSKEKNYGPIITFHLSRLIGFFVLGGLIGLIGSAFILSGTAFFMLNTILFFVMIIMGLNLLGFFELTKTTTLKLPNIFGKHILKLRTKQGNLAAAIMGAGTFILPCGFTQSMQIYSLTTGSFLQGALTMLVFALGTFPVLAAVSLISFKLKTNIFFATSGFLVIIFAFYNFISSLIGLGII